MFASSAPWPPVTFASVPPLTAAERLASGVREAARAKPDGRLDLCALLALGRFELRLSTLGARGGIEGVLAPRPSDSFLLVVDTEPRGGWSLVARSLREDLVRHRLRFRVAHEIGHSFFYDRSGQRPRRLVFDSPEQERWCDRFASALLLPPPALATACPAPETLLSLHDRFDVSLQVAVRAMARLHRGHFVALLVARRPRPPHIRVQWQKRHGAPAARWWTADELQYALAGGDRSGALDVAWPRGMRLASWRALPERGQLLVVA